MNFIKSIDIRKQKSLLGGGFLFLFLMLLALASSPILHKWIHDDADDAGHDCAVTLILSGKSDAPPSSASIEFGSAALFLIGEHDVVQLDIFSYSAYLLEHAPPFAS
jgi:hypothetical protein